MKKWMKSHHFLQMKTKTLNTYYIYDFSCKSFKTTEQREITVVEYFPHSWQNYACVLSRFSRVRLRDLMDWRPPGSSVHGILQARILEWVAISSSRGSS